MDKKSILDFRMFYAVSSRTVAGRNGTQCLVLNSFPQKCGGKGPRNFALYDSKPNMTD
jgi:hypothetical protein